MLGTVRLLFRSVLIVCLTLAYRLALGLETIVRRADEGALASLWAQRWSRAFFTLLRVDFEARGPFVEGGLFYPGTDDSSVGRIFVMNHRSGLDIAVALYVAEGRLLSRKDLASWPVIGGIARRLGTVFVDRSSRRSGATALREMQRVLESGQGITVFPEGAALGENAVRPFHQGAFNAARRAGAEIVPIGVAYSNEDALYRAESFGAHMARAISLPAMAIRVEVGEPIPEQGRTAVEWREETRGAVQQLLDSARSRLEESSNRAP
ncbi:MAG: lysophospholipid acyltransferase family protein [Planctomycetota bacterium]